MSSEERLEFRPGWFTLGRVWPFPTFYEEWKTPVTQDVLLMGWVVAFFALLLPFYLVIPASSYKLSRFIRVTAFLLQGLFIMLCNFGQEWEVGYLTTRTPYKAGTADQIKAEVGIKLGLRSVNITLKGEPETANSSLEGETINYNERFSWTWAQGRPGFGPYAGRLHREFRAAQHRGAPLPILWVAEYFTFDGDGIRFGRYYRTAGWYSHIFIWCAFPTWVITIFMFKMVIFYAAIACALTGVLMVIPALIWLCLRNPIEMQILFEDGILQTRFGWCFYLSLITGIVSIIIGGVVAGLSRTRFNNKLSAFFGHNPWSILELEDEEEAIKPKPSPVADSNEMEMQTESSTSSKTEFVRRVTMRTRGGPSSQYQNKVSLEVPSSDDQYGISSLDSYPSSPVSPRSPRQHGRRRTFSSAGPGGPSTSHLDTIEDEGESLGKHGYDEDDDDDDFTSEDQNDSVFVDQMMQNSRSQLITDE